MIFTTHKNRVKIEKLIKKANRKCAFGLLGLFLDALDVVPAEFGRGHALIAEILFRAGHGGVQRRDGLGFGSAGREEQSGGRGGEEREDVFHKVDSL